MSAINEIGALLKEAIGLDAASIGVPAVERAVEKRRLARKAKSLETYLDHLRASPIELQALIEEVVVSETWFFRDEEAFKALTGAVVKNWFPTPAGGLNLLSIPCATGEEPFSMAMALETAGLAPQNYRIEAVDVSEHALARARRSIYGKNSFRSKDLEFRDRYFEKEAGGYQVVNRLRERIHFQRANLLHPDFFAGTPPFHFIFCRNLLIYLDQTAQNKAIGTLKRILDPQGLLFVGPAEAALMLNHQLEPLNHTLAFAFRKESKTTGHLPEKGQMVPRRKHSAALSPRCPSRRTKVWPSPSAVFSQAPPAPPLKEGDDLNRARRLADEGRLKEASVICEKYLQEDRSSTEALYLLGLIGDATGDHQKAGSYYRKVLYLEPEHYESLLHLSYFAEKEGNLGASQNLRARAERIMQRGEHA